jgi:hypothetical protein
MTIDLSDPLEWNIVYRDAVQADGDKPIPPISIPVNSFEIVVGIFVGGKPYWRWGGYLVQYVAQLPSSTAQLFPLVSPLVQVQSFRLTCTAYQGLRLDNDKPLPYICRITLPKYFRAAQIELYARNDI